MQPLQKKKKRKRKEKRKIGNLKQVKFNHKEFQVSNEEKPGRRVQTALEGALTTAVAVDLPGSAARARAGDRSTEGRGRGPGRPRARARPAAARSDGVGAKRVKYLHGHFLRS